MSAQSDPIPEKDSEVSGTAWTPTAAGQGFSRGEDLARAGGKQTLPQRGFGLGI